MTLTLQNNKTEQPNWTDGSKQFNQNQLTANNIQEELINYSLNSDGNFCSGCQNISNH